MKGYFNHMTNCKSTIRTFKTLISLFVFFVLTTSYAQNLDTSFGTNGLAIHNLGLGGQSSIRIYKEVKDGKALILGTYDIDSQKSHKGMFIARIDGEYQLDPTFGTNGLTYFGLGPLTDQPLQLHQANDNSLIISALRLKKTNNGSQSQRYLAKISENGIIDTSFAENGYYENSSTPLSDKLVVFQDTVYSITTSPVRLLKIDLHSGDLISEHSISSSFEFWKKNNSLSFLSISRYYTRRKVLFSEYSLERKLIMQLDTLAIDNSEFIDNFYVYQTEHNTFISLGVDNSNYDTDAYLIKLTADGKIDSNFSENGLLNINQIGIDKIIPLEDDSHVITYSAMKYDLDDNDTSTVDFYKYDKDFQLDPLFGDSGIQHFPRPFPFDYLLLDNDLIINQRLGQATVEKYSTQVEPLEQFKILSKHTFDFAKRQEEIVDFELLDSENISVLDKDKLLQFNSQGFLFEEYGDSGVVQFDANFFGMEAMGNDLILAEIRNRTQSNSRNGIRFTKVDEQGNVIPSFGTSGTLEFWHTSSNHTGTINSFAVTEDEKILFDNVDGSKINIWQFTSDGKPDYSFGNNGVSQISLGGYWGLNYQSDWVKKIVPGPDGKIYLLGSTLITRRFNDILIIDYARVFVARLLKNGTLDNSFKHTGIVKLSIEDLITWNNQLLNDYPVDLEIGDDGLYILARNVRSENVVLKLDFDGLYDESFGVNGITTIPNDPGHFTNLRDLHLQDGGLGIVLTGKTQTDDRDNFLIMRRKKNGSPDSSFGNNGQLDNIIGGPRLESIGTETNKNGKLISFGTYEKDYLMIGLSAKKTPNLLFEYPDEILVNTELELNEITTDSDAPVTILDVSTPAISTIENNKIVTNSETGIINLKIFQDETSTYNSDTLYVAIRVIKSEPHLMVDTIKRVYLNSDTALTISSQSPGEVIIEMTSDPVLGSVDGNRVKSNSTLGKIRLSISQLETENFYASDTIELRIIIESAPIGFDELSQQAIVNVYPNPTVDKITIDNINQNSGISIYSLDGIMVLHQPYIGTKMTLEVDQLKPSTYIIIVNGTAHKLSVN